MSVGASSKKTFFKMGGGSSVCLESTPPPPAPRATENPDPCAGASWRPRLAPPALVQTWRAVGWGSAGSVDGGEILLGTVQKP